MSEQLPHSNPEHIATYETEKTAEKPREREEAIHEHSEKKPDSLESIQKKIEAAAISGKEVPVGDRSESTPSQRSVNQQLKSNAYNRTMVRVRKHLSPIEKPLSKLIHQPAIEAISNTGGKTLARPSGILTGGLLALLGTSTLLYMAKHDGFRYNRAVFILLFVGGYALGLVLELLVYAVRKAKRA
jgi:hypothetical protein